MPAALLFVHLPIGRIADDRAGDMLSRRTWRQFAHHPARRFEARPPVRIHYRWLCCLWGAYFFRKKLRQLRMLAAIRRASARVRGLSAARGSSK
jgi:hypothetical protein